MNKQLAITINKTLKDMFDFFRAMKESLNDLNGTLRAKMKKISINPYKSNLNNKEFISILKINDNPAIPR